MYLHFLAFADDIALLSPNPEAAQRCLDRLYYAAIKVGLQISSSKTEVLHVGTATKPNLSLPTGDIIKSCSDFTYLGAKIWDSKDIVEQRLRLAWFAARSLSTVFHSEAADIIKIRLFRAAVEPVLAYALETVPMPQSRASRLDAAFRHLQRFALGIHHPYTISIENLTARSGVPTFRSILARRRLALLAHTARATTREAPTPLALALQYPPTEMFRRGMANLKTLPQQFQEDLIHANLSFDQMKTIKRDYIKSIKF